MWQISSVVAAVLLASAVLALLLMRESVDTNASFPNSLELIETVDSKSNVRNQSKMAFVHIGPHKTATKHIQDLMEEHSQDLEDSANALFVRCNHLADWIRKKNNPNFVASFFENVQSLSWTDIEHEALQQLIVIRRACKENKSIVLSAEEFEDFKNVDIIYLKNMLSCFEITIVAFLRNWLMREISAYDQIYQNDQNPDFLTQFLTLRADMESTTGTVPKLSRFVQVFGMKRLRLIDFEIAKLSEIDMVNVFMIYGCGFKPFQILGSKNITHHVGGTPPYVREFWGLFYKNVLDRYSCKMQLTHQRLTFLQERLIYYTQKKRVDIPKVSLELAAFKLFADGVQKSVEREFAGGAYVTPKTFKSYNASDIYSEKLPIDVIDVRIYYDKINTFETHIFDPFIEIYKILESSKCRKSHVKDISNTTNAVSRRHKNQPTSRS